MTSTRAQDAAGRPDLAARALAAAARLSVARAGAGDSAAFLPAAGAWVATRALPPRAAAAEPPPPPPPDFFAGAAGADEAVRRYAEWHAAAMARAAEPGPAGRRWRRHRLLVYRPSHHGEGYAPPPPARPPPVLPPLPPPPAPAAARAAAAHAASLPRRGRHALPVRPPAHPPPRFIDRTLKFF